MASAWTLQLHTVSFPRGIWGNAVEMRRELGCFNHGGWLNRKIGYAKLVVVRATTSDAAVPSDQDSNTAAAAAATTKQPGIEDEAQQLILVQNQNDDEKAANSQNLVSRFRETISFPPVIFLMKKRYSGTSYAIGLCIAATVLVIMARGYMGRRKRHDRPGSVADLVRRGQLKSDRRGISTPLKYEDPFNNPMVKVGKGNSTVEMCGKVFRLAPVSLTKEQQAIHKKRRSRAYQWKRPTIFLREGDPIPPDVDPDTVRWIPANHPFATTASDIDEDLAQTNVYQKHGVPFRIQAEHEALQRRLEMLQNEQKLGKLTIDPSVAKEFERPFKSHLKSEVADEQNPGNGQVGSKPPKSDHTFNSLPKKPASEEMQKP